MATAAEPEHEETPASTEPDKVFRVYVGNLSTDVDERTLRKVFDEQGIVVGTILVKRSYAFADCPDQTNVDRAIDRLNGHQLKGSVMQVEPAMSRRRSNKVQIRNFPPHVGAEEIENLVKRMGPVQKCELVGAEGLIYVTFENPETAQQVVQQLNGYEIDGLGLKVDFASNKTRRTRIPSQNNSSGNRTVEMPLRILVGSEYIGAIIGREGQTIRNITSQTRARVDVHRRDNNTATETPITIKGTPESCTNACLEIMRIVHAEAQALNKGKGTQEDMGNRTKDYPLRMLCPNTLCGRIIGKNGTTIKGFIEESGAHVVVSSVGDASNYYYDRVITITGPLENASKAEALISEKMRKCLELDQQNFNSQVGMYGYQGGPPGGMSMPSNFNYPSPRGGGYPPFPVAQGNHMYNMYGGPAMQPPSMEELTIHVYIPEASVGAVIGQKGSNIKTIMRLSSARVKIVNNQGKNGDMNGEKRDRPDRPPQGRSDERKVIITGTSESLWKAQFYIIEKIRSEGSYGGNLKDEIQFRSEIMVPKHLIGRIIGKGGQNVKEMQRVSNAKVKTPDTKSFPDGDEVPVTIYGDFYASQSAQHRIRLLISQQNQGNREMGGPGAPPGMRRGPQQNGN